MSTPMLKQYDKLKSQYKDCVLLFRLGDFYEAFNEDAKNLSKTLGITLTGRGKGESRIPMAGIPHHSLDNYLYKLVNAGFKVAMAEQLTEAKQGEIVERDVVKVYTKGTFTDNKNIDDSQNLYISCIYDNKSEFYLAFLDLSTGDFFVETFNSAKAVENELNTRLPQEILLSEKNKLQNTLNHSLEKIDEDLLSFDRSYELLNRHFGTKNLKGFGFTESDQSIIPLGVLLQYAKDHQKTDINHIVKVYKLQTDDLMHLDSSTIRNLELFNNSVYSDKQLSLYDVLNFCKTPMGKRKLRHWIYKPLVNQTKIEFRLNVVNELSQNLELSKTIANLSTQILDIERLIAKIGTGSVNPRDIYGVKISLQNTSELYKTILYSKLTSLNKINKYLNPDKYLEIVNLIGESINEEPPVKFDKGGVIKPGYSSEVDELREIMNSGEEKLSELQVRERASTKIDSLKVKFNKVFGYYIEVTKTHSAKIPTHYVRKQTLVNSERYITEELKEFENKILGAEEKLLALEIKIFGELIEKITNYISTLQSLSNAVATVDVLNNFALLSNERGYVKPRIVTETIFDIKNSRHPVIELLEKEKYIPNDINADSANLISIITGPNMSGKSTYIRQVALISLMAQIGCFVPADKAKIGIADRIFTRVGAGDNLVSGESTFMVEMNETSNILNNATEKSIIILDEVGRGTSTYDGVAIAWAIIEYLDSKIKARTFFATHYHELIELADKLKHTKNLHVDVIDSNNTVVFTHKIKDGGMGKSYGIHVAEMAGIPSEVIENANFRLRKLEDTDKIPEIHSKNTKKPKKTEQFSLL